MTELRELTESGQRLVERVLEEGDPVDEIDDSTIREHSVRIEGLEADLNGLHGQLDEIIEDVDECTVNVDVAAAEPIREYIDISRRQAARDRLWHWLTVAEFSDFVYHRWRKFSAIDEKFLGAGTNIYSNALHRLWWGAELTRDDDSYDKTEALFSQGELANDVLDRWFARYSPASKAVVDHLKGEESNTISDRTRDFRNRLSGYKLEMMYEEDINDLLERL